MIAFVLTFSACAGDSKVVSADSGQTPDQSPFTQDVGGPSPDVPTVYACDTIDLLFVIDNSGSMFQEQESLMKSFPTFIQQIEAIEPKIKSYHVGVVSTDVGSGPHTYTGSSCKPGGDEGKLKHDPVGAGCSGTYPKYLEGPSATMADDFSCIAALGTTGCGFEQQLEAALQALSGQSYNDGFLRKNAPLAIIFITDEDDCSADPKLFDPADTALGSLKTRCVAQTQLLKPVADYVAAFKALKDNPDRLVVAAITGPPGKVVIDETKFAGQEPICSSPEFGEAAAGNRFGELVTAFGDRGVQTSLCDGDLAKGLEVIGKAIERVCLE
ncbi:MAG: hypothetical protein CSA65_06790 [Proteobacteria bacterium]|nr:MAG: hypothetical protein CSA65_06790 [Pseudomonadota bacterium]